jgi:alkylhydroperoxidase family enzyme
VPDTRPVPAPLFMRVVLGGLGLVQLVDGAWALLAPRSFYDDFPAGRGGWVSALPAYNEHLLRDVGALFLATGVVMVWAAIALERRLTLVALVSWLVWATPHLIFHLFNLEPYGTVDKVGNVVSLVLTVVPPAILLWLLIRQPPAVSGGRSADPGDEAPARIDGVEKGGGPIVAYAYRESRKRFGHVPEPVKVTAHHPGLMFGYGMLELATERATRVDERTKLLGVMKAAQLAGCEWCLDFGSAESRAKGIPDEDLKALLDHRASDRFTEAEKLVIDYAIGMTRTPVEVSDELFASLREHFDEPQLVEITSAIAIENYRSRFNWAFGIGGEGFSDGAYCVPPAAMDAAAVQAPS